MKRPQKGIDRVLVSKVCAPEGTVRPVFERPKLRRKMGKRLHDRGIDESSHREDRTAGGFRRIQPGLCKAQSVHDRSVLSTTHGISTRGDPQELVYRPCQALRSLPSWHEQRSQDIGHRNAKHRRVFCGGGRKRTNRISGSCQHLDELVMNWGDTCRG